MTEKVVGSGKSSWCLFENKHGGQCHFLGCSCECHSQPGQEPTLPPPPPKKRSL